MCLRLGISGASDFDDLPMKRREIGYKSSREHHRINFVVWSHFFNRNSIYYRVYEFYNGEQGWIRPSGYLKSKDFSFRKQTDEDLTRPIYCCWGQDGSCNFFTWVFLGMFGKNSFDSDSLIEMISRRSDSMILWDEMSMQTYSVFVVNKKNQLFSVPNLQFIS